MALGFCYRMCFQLDRDNHSMTSRGVVFLLGNRDSDGGRRNAG